jgi:hypothetical protein
MMFKLLHMINILVVFEKNISLILMNVFVTKMNELKKYTKNKKIRNYLLFNKNLIYKYTGFDVFKTKTNLIFL